MILTHENYHTLDNRYLTKSRIKDFLRCKRYFYELHISGEKQKKDKDVFRVGQATDTWLTKSKDEFMRKFICVSRRSLKNPPTNYTELTQTQYDEIVNMCEVVERQPAYQELCDHTAQEIISVDMPMGEHFVGLAGIPDWYKIEGDTCIITDLKTSNDTNERKHHYKCMDFGYYMQFAVMTIIFRSTRPEMRKFVYRHLVIDKDPDGVNTPYTFLLDNERVEVYINILQNEIIPMIASEKEFSPKKVTWESAVRIGSLDEGF